MIRRVYFGNWLRDYSQALDVGTLKGVQAATLRIIVWVLSFMSFGYATGEFEVTEERLGVYRPEEHIDNPKDYADNLDARQYDPRLRPPVQPVELHIDPDTGMKNYIANERGGWATSSAFIKQSFARSIHYGRQYTSGSGSSRGRETDLCEALRCLGQGLHCLEDFGAHTNYTELALRELGLRNVFPHTGTATEINLRGHRVFPLVTGTFGAVDFLHSVLGEATDHFAQTEVEQVDIALGDAQRNSKSSSGESSGSNLTSLLSKVPGAGELCRQAEKLQAQADAQERASMGAHGFAHNRGIDDYPGSSRGVDDYHQADRAPPPTFAAPPGAPGGPPGPGIPGMSPSFDPVKVAAQIYPILEFRDKVVKTISATIEKIPGLEALVEKITETLTIFILSLLAPFIRPIINAVSAQLKAGSSSVVDASGKHQYEPWTDPYCTDPTHSLLSKDHFSNILNEPAGQIAAAILQYVSPRIIYAWEHPDVPVQQVLDDVVRVFHHPAIRDPHCEIHRKMFDVVHHWINTRPDRGASLDNILSAESVRQGKNDRGESTAAHSQSHSQCHSQGYGHGHSQGYTQSHSHGGLPSAVGNILGSAAKVGGAPWDKLMKLKDATGSRRDDIGGGSYPGGGAEYHSTPPVNDSTGYQPPPNPPHQPQQHHYEQPPYPSDYPSDPSYNTYTTQPPYQQPYTSSYSAPPPAEPHQYPSSYHQDQYHPPPSPGNPPYPSQDYPQDQGQAYSGANPYTHDPNAPPPQGQYGYGGSPAPPQQGQGEGYGHYYDGRGY